MYTIDEKILSVILKRKFNALIGSVCERLERTSELNLSSKDLIDQMKFEFKKSSYSTMREIEEQVSSFSDGTKIMVELR